MPMRHAANLEATPYFRHSAVIFEEGAKAPEPDSKSKMPVVVILCMHRFHASLGWLIVILAAMLCVHPHGIVGLGGSTLASTNAFFNCKIHWLRSEEHKSELQSLMRSSYCVFC